MPQFRSLSEIEFPGRTVTKISTTSKNVAALSIGYMILSPGKAKPHYLAQVDRTLVHAFDSPKHLLLDPRRGRICREYIAPPVTQLVPRRDQPPLFAPLLLDIKKNIEH